jgi:hypothetical protein
MLATFAASRDKVGALALVGWLDGASQVRLHWWAHLALRVVRPSAKPMAFAVAEALRLIHLHSAFQHLTMQVRLEAHYLWLECSVPPQSVFAYSVHLVTRWGHSRGWMQNCQTQDLDCRLAHSEYCLMCQRLDPLADCLSVNRFQLEQENLDSWVAFRCLAHCLLHLCCVPLDLLRGRVVPLFRQEIASPRPCSPASQVVETKHLPRRVAPRLG